MVSEKLSRITMSTTSSSSSPALPPTSAHSSATRHPYPLPATFSCRTLRHNCQGGRLTFFRRDSYAPYFLQRHRQGKHKQQLNTIFAPLIHSKPRLFFMAVRPLHPIGIQGWPVFGLVVCGLVADSFRHISLFFSCSFDNWSTSVVLHLKSISVLPCN